MPTIPLPTDAEIITGLLKIITEHLLVRHAADPLTVSDLNVIEAARQYAEKAR